MALGSCKECAYWVRNKEVQYLGDCRRHPPTLVVLEDAYGMSPLRSEWPETDQDAGCGEFKAEAQ